MAMVSYQHMAQRMDLAVSSFCETLQSFVPMDDATAKKVLAYYVKCRLVKRDIAQGKYHVVHGALLDVDTIKKAMSLVCKQPT